MNAIKFSFKTPVTGSQFVRVIDVNISHPHVRNPANWVCCNIIKKYDSDLDFIECYDNTITFITSDQTLLERITTDANAWIEKLRPKPQKRYIVEGIGLLNTDQLMEIVSSFAPIIRVIPRYRLRHVKKGSKFANSAMVSVEGDRGLPSKVLYSSLGRTRYLTFTEQLNKPNNSPQRLANEQQRRSSWSLQGRDGKSTRVHPSPYTSSGAEIQDMVSDGGEDPRPSPNPAPRLRKASQTRSEGKASGNGPTSNRRSQDRIKIAATHNVTTYSKDKKKTEKPADTQLVPGLDVWSVPVSRGSISSPQRPRNSNLSTSLANPTGSPLRPGERRATQPAEDVPKAKPPEPVDHEEAVPDSIQLAARKVEDLKEASTDIVSSLEAEIDKLEHEPTIEDLDATISYLKRSLSAPADPPPKRRLSVPSAVKPTVPTKRNSLPTSKPSNVASSTSSRDTNEPESTRATQEL